jgi:hypothetical protein
MAVADRVGVQILPLLIYIKNPYLKGQGHGIRMGQKWYGLMGLV